MLVKIAYSDGYSNTAWLGVTDETKSVSSTFAGVGGSFTLTVTAYENTDASTGNNIDPGDRQIGSPIVLMCP